MRVELRPMVASDIPQVREIEREAFPTNGFLTPYERELERTDLASYLVAWTPDLTMPEPVQRSTSPLRRFLSGIESWLGNGPQPQEQPPREQPLIVGYIGLWVAGDEAHITAIAVREQFRRQGIGELLMLGAIQETRARHLRRLTLEVRVSNTGAQQLYEKYGFRTLGIRRGYYTAPREDAYIMGTDPIDTPAYQERLARLQEAYQARYGDTRRIVATHSS
jgi:ribosomal-protein-alanine N-acetyltransferase